MNLTWRLPMRSRTPYRMAGNDRAAERRVASPARSKDGSLRGICIRGSLCRLLAQENRTSEKCRKSFVAIAVRRRETDATICGRFPGVSGSGRRISSNRRRFARSSGVRGQIVRGKSRNARLRRYRDIGDCCALLPPAGLAWLVVGARPSVALRAGV